MFLVCGEGLLDVFAAGETPGGLALDGRVGGSPLNVAIGLARLGQPVAFFGGISRDVVGERLMHALRAEGVETATVVRSDAPSTLSLVGVDARGVPSYAFLGKGAADRQPTPASLDALPSRWRAIHVGSYATVVPPIASTLRALVGRERDRALIAFDPNVRLNVEPDVGAWRATLESMQPCAHLLKVSEEDLALLHPGLPAPAFARSALDAGVRLVVVTRGSAGASAWTATQHAQVGAMPVEVADTVGAGDAFQAALLAWLAEHDRLDADRLASLDAASLRALLQFATRAAALACSRRGAELPHRAELG